MTIAPETADRPAPPTEYGRPRATLQVLRGTATVHALFALAQPVLAGSYLAGNFDALLWHGAINGHVIQLVGLIQLGASIAYTTVGRGRIWPVLASIGFVLAEGAQVGFGYGRELAFHLPLGVTIVTAQVLFTAWLFSPAARRGRPLKTHS